MNVPRTRTKNAKDVAPSSTRFSWMSSSAVPPTLAGSAGCRVAHFLDDTLAPDEAHFAPFGAVGFVVGPGNRAGVVDRGDRRTQRARNVDHREGTVAVHETALFRAADDRSRGVDIGRSRLAAQRHVDPVVDAVPEEEPAGRSSGKVVPHHVAVSIDGHRPRVRRTGNPYREVGSGCGLGVVAGRSGIDRSGRRGGRPGENRQQNREDKPSHRVPPLPRTCGRRQSHGRRGPRV
jgi:hypothetical protein